MEYQKELEELNSMRHKKAVESLTFKQKQDSLFSTIIIRSEVRNQLAAFSVGLRFTLTSRANADGVATAASLTVSYVHRCIRTWYGT